MGGGASVTSSHHVQQTGKLKKWDVKKGKWLDYWAVLNEGSLELYNARKVGVM